MDSQPTQPHVAAPSLGHPGRAVIARRLLEAFIFKDRRQFGSRSRGRKLTRECPICGFEGRFLSLERGQRLDSRCPGCGSRERHRLQHLFLSEGGGWKLAGQRVLHFAPERYMLKLMRGNPLYVSGDLRQPDAAQHIDATSIPYPDGSFDVVIANHVLEHIPEDRKALSEFARVLRAGGLLLLAVPQNHAAAETDEDLSVIAPMERFWRFTGYDHCRMYGRDFPERVAAAGFEVTPYTRSPSDQLRYALRRDEILFVGRRL
ncbi:MAG: methyltransferase domain-containing protein [Proteobacteria bacterium]|nr:methyltransferase domain-containing protein [Pseudomonadota bacterium]